MRKTLHFKIISLHTYNVTWSIVKGDDDTKTNISNSIRFDAMEKKYDKCRKKTRNGQMLASTSSGYQLKTKECKPVDENITKIPLLKINDAF